MKKLTVLAVLLTVISAATFADERKISETSKFQMVAKSDVKYELSYFSKKKGDVSVIIYNDKGQRMSSTTVKDANLFRRTYDFSKLGPGKYKVVVKNEDGSASQEIEYKIKEDILKVFVGKVPNTKALKLHVGDFHSNKAVNIKIYDQDNNLIYRDAIRNAQSFSRVFNLKNISAKSVSVLIENDGETRNFTHSLN